MVSLTLLFQFSLVEMPLKKSLRLLHVRNGCRAAQPLRRESSSSEAAGNNLISLLIGLNMFIYHTHKKNLVLFI